MCLCGDDGCVAVFLCRGVCVCLRRVSMCVCGGGCLCMSVFVWGCLCGEGFCVCLLEGSLQMELRGVRVPEAEVTGCSESPHMGTGTQTPALCMAGNTLAHLAISPTPLSIYLNMYDTVQEFVKLC